MKPQIIISRKKSTLKAIKNELQRKFKTKMCEANADSVDFPLMHHICPDTAIVVEGYELAFLASNTLFFDKWISRFYDQDHLQTFKNPTWVFLLNIPAHEPYPELGDNVDKYCLDDECQMSITDVRRLIVNRAEINRIHYTKWNSEDKKILKQYYQNNIQKILATYTQKQVVNG